MRICIITKFIPPVSTDGIPRNRWDYARQFRALGHEVHIITSGKEASEQIVEGIYIHQIPSWDKEVFENTFIHLNVSEFVRNLLSYSYLVYRRIKELHEKSPIHIIDSPLWDIEGYVTKLRLPGIPFVVRLETTSMIMKEVLSGKSGHPKDILNEIETHFLKLADAFVFDSWSILKETERLYQQRFDQKPYAVIHHGITLSDAPAMASPSPSTGKFRILSVGRLEKRKGSDILIREILPQLLQADPNIEVHLVGKDGGEWDDIKKETGLDYHGYIRKHYKNHLDKQVFLYGYVSDEKLDQLYGTADTVLALSRYESFGLLYLEAMRKGKPLIVFNTGAVPEIFDHEQDAIIVPIDQPTKVVDSVIRLQKDPALRARLSANALEKLKSRYSAARMAKECSLFFEDLVFRKSEQQILQVMNCLTDRDGVSNITVDYNTVLNQSAIQTKIIGDWSTEAVKHLQNPIEGQQFSEADILVFHYWNYCERGEFFNKLSAPKKVFFFHNITTPSFFNENDEAYKSTTKGFRQLSSLDNYDVYVGLSSYSVDILKQSFKQPITTFIMPPLVDKREILQRPYNNDLVLQSKNSTSFHIIFVGSIAPHKRQTDLVKFFQYYTSKVNPNAHLTIIGGGAEKYVAQLKQLVEELNLKKQITITGKISDSDLYAWYRVADVYLSMSEHEGFGVPLAEAMAFDLPVVAYNCTAIPDTVGDNGMLFHVKDHELIAHKLESLRKDVTARSEVLALQHQHLKRFSTEAVQKAFTELIALVNTVHCERMSRVKAKAELFIEQDISINDESLNVKGDWTVRENQYLLSKGQAKDNLISFSKEFSEIALSFVSHPWSGQVLVTINDEHQEIIDLYDEDNKVKKYKINKQFPLANHEVTIKALGECNKLARDVEVLFSSATIMSLISRNGKKPPVLNTLACINRVKIPILKGSKPIEEKRPKGYVVFDQEFGHNHASLLYTGAWEERDGKYMLCKDYSGASYMQTTMFFSELELYFIHHAWSGSVKITVDDEFEERFELYDSSNSIKPIKLSKRFTEGQHKVRIQPLPLKNERSKGHEVILEKIIGYSGQLVEVREEELQKNFKVSVVINTLNRADHIEKLLPALEKQTYPYFEVVVVNGPSTDKTEEILECYKGRIKVAHCPEANLSWSRNIGIENAGGNWVAFIDDDAIPGDEYWIENFVNYILWKKDPSIGVVGGPVKHRETEHYEFRNGATSDYGAQIFRSEEVNAINTDGARWVQGVRGANNIILKKALYEIGGFDQRFIYYLDETDVCFQISRKGYKIINHPNNYVRHFSGNGEFRKSQFDMKWDVITRSDTYFCLKTGYDNKLVRLLKTYVNLSGKHFYVDILNAYRQKAISKGEYKKYMRLIKSGFREGIMWGLFSNKKINYLKNTASTFLSFIK